MAAPAASRKAATNPGGRQRQLSRCWLMGRPMSLVFHNPIALFGIASVAFIVNAISADGETTWFEGVLLIGVYVLFGMAFFFSAPIA